MRGHLLGMLEPAAILQVNRHTGRAPGVTANRRQQTGVSKPSFRARLRIAPQALCRLSTWADNAVPALSTL